MAYNISLSNGEPLVTIADGAVDVNYTSLSLIGKNFAGYGQLMNENWVHLLENFSNSAEPNNPLVGQLWYDATSKIMKVRTSAGTWKNIGSATASDSAPDNPVVGDQWWDTVNQQLKTWSGSSWKLIGPLFSAAEGTTGSLPDTIRDILGEDHVVIKFYINNVVTGIWSKDTNSYIVDPAAVIPGFYNEGEPMIVKPGLTMADLGNTNAGGYTNVPRTTIWGTAENTLRMGGVSSNNFLRRDATGNAQTVEDSVQFNNNQAILLGGSVGVLDNNLWDIGASNFRLKTVFATTFNGVATSAQYADLAERFEADQLYEPGTVVAIGGEKEITAVKDELSDDVFGVISTRPAHLMNAGAGTDITHPPIAISGRVPVKVKGRVRKGQRLVSAGNGLARAADKSEITSFNVIGRALTNKNTDGIGTVEAIVKLTS
jgi:hypothetical protein